MKKIPATVRVATELEEEGRQQPVDITLRGVLEIEVIISDQGRLGILYVFNILDNGGA
jgi:hypothetical protein